MTDRKFPSKGQRRRTPQVAASALKARTQLPVELECSRNLGQIFISYSHDSEQHRINVLGLANRLRADNVDAIVDRYAPEPPEGWARWMEAQLEDASFVLVVLSSGYRASVRSEDASQFGHGAWWEVKLIRDMLYENQGPRTAVVGFDQRELSSIPLFLRSVPRFLMPAQYENLRGLLRNQPDVAKPPLGSSAKLPVLKVRSEGALATIVEFNKGRDPDAIQKKYNKMFESPYNFFRGTSHLFYSGLPQSELLEQSPAAWACGDLSPHSFGMYYGDDDLPYFDIVYFSEAVLAPCIWDPFRFLVGIMLFLDEVGFTSKSAKSVCSAFLDCYESAVGGGTTRWVDRRSATGRLRKRLKRLEDREDSLNRFTVTRGGKRTIRSDTSFVRSVERERYGLVASIVSEISERAKQDSAYKILDVAARVAGTGSIGLERYVVLVEDNRKPSQYLLLDVKKAMPPSALARLTLPQPTWSSEAHRIAVGQRLMQAIPPRVLSAAVVEKNSYIVTELPPNRSGLASDNDLDLLALEDDVRTMGAVLAWAQMRSSGRNRAATFDQLSGYLGETSWKTELIGLAKDYSSQTASLWKQFRSGIRKGKR